MKSKQINTCWRKFCPNVAQDSTRCTTDPVKEIMKEIIDMARKKR